MVEEITSPAWSFKGYSFIVWAKKNKDNFKLILSGLFGLIAVLVSGLDSTYSVPLGTIVAVGTKLVLDAVEYYLTEQ
jgi:hypothetical protein